MAEGTEPPSIGERQTVATANMPPVWTDLPAPLRARYAPIRHGTGVKIEHGGIVSVHYTGRVAESGTVFDRTRTEASDVEAWPFEFTAGSGQALPPLDHVALTSCVGDSYLLHLDPPPPGDPEEGLWFDSHDVPKSHAVEIEVDFVGFVPPDPSSTPLARAARLKDRANADYRAAISGRGDVDGLRKALKGYEDAIALMTPPTSSPTSTPPPPTDATPSPTTTTLLSLLLNASQTLLKLRTLGVLRVPIGPSSTSSPNSAPDTSEDPPDEDPTDADAAQVALEYSHRAVGIAPDSAKAHFRAGAAAAVLGRWNEAETSLGRAAELDPADPAPPRELALVCKRRKDEAWREREAYRRAVEG
ncbi:hypothetical protein M427DRAFT_53658 [Gonapodya prolifera JEL478]|uniref:peptidylprolyl isomerase n=1 Tax=Gonapodya prolifera (strain JEL478) TaxID=1344416 RepID=A0A139AQD2_GONPJ|nr:hypothetical protein M427DRAFT_53658 [Gonapodya prolifera JEL478]|eukprot:KXS18713.1 hypothetical protein M427DRAFT_53658 [Gonapodya prolifera JEL478]